MSDSHRCPCCSKLPVKDGVNRLCALCDPRLGSWFQEAAGESPAKRLEDEYPLFGMDVATGPDQTGVAVECTTCNGSDSHDVGTLVLLLDGRLRAISPYEFELLHKGRGVRAFESGPRHHRVVGLDGGCYWLFVQCEHDASVLAVHLGIQQRFDAVPGRASLELSVE